MWQTKPEYASAVPKYLGAVKAISSLGVRNPWIKLSDEFVINLTRMSFSFAVGWSTVLSAIGIVVGSSRCAAIGIVTKLVNMETM